MARQVINPTIIREDVGVTPGLAQWAEDVAWQWLWHRLAAAAPIQPLAQDLPYATGAALNRRKKKKKRIRETVT